MPRIIKAFSASLTHTQVGLIAMIPYLFATMVMVPWSRSSDKRRERRLHSAIPLAVAVLASSPAEGQFPAEAATACFRRIPAATPLYFVV